jgi:hypothetical protein
VEVDLKVNLWKERKYIMGGCEFIKGYVGKETPRDAFNELTESARHSHGHDGYTGTIAEKDGFIMRECPPRKDPEKYANEIMEENDKWGPAYCIEVKRSYLQKLKKRPYNVWCKGKRGIRAYIFCGIASC